MQNNVLKNFALKNEKFVKKIRVKKMKNFRVKK